MALYAVAGLDTKIDLPVQLIQSLLAFSPEHRPGYALVKPWKWIQHETANTAVGADAAMHNRWLHQGAGGEYVSFHFCVDDHSIYQFVPINEVTWQAADGNGPGNYSCISCELCVNADGDEAKARHNAEALCGGILKAIGGSGADIGRHWDYNYMLAPADRHHCPDHMMNEGYWPTFVANATKIIGGTIVSGKYPQGHDDGTFAAIWSSLNNDAAKTYPYNEKGVISSLWREANDQSPLAWHFKDKTSGREFFNFASGLSIGRYNSSEAFRVLKGV